MPVLTEVEGEDRVRDGRRSPVGDKEVNSAKAAQIVTAGLEPRLFRPGNRRDMAAEDDSGVRPLARAEQTERASHSARGAVDVDRTSALCSELLRVVLDPSRATAASVTF